MSKSPDAAAGSTASTTDAEMRLKKAMEIATSKKTGDKHQLNLKTGRYQQPRESASANALSSTELRLKEAMEMAALKMESGKIGGQQSSADKGQLGANKTKTPKSAWLVRQAGKLLGNLNLKFISGNVKPNK